MNMRPGLIGGRSNHTPPTPAGEQQAHRYGLYLKEEQRHPDIVIASGAMRTNMTGQIALASAGLSHEIVIDERLQEISQGPFEGRLRHEVYTPEIIERYRLSELDGCLPGAESIADAQIRMHEFVSDIHAAYPEGTVLIFGHGLSIRALAGSILRQTKQEILTTVTDNVSETYIDVFDNQPTVRYVGKNVIGE
jgi:probable phosphoglycerate mutase